MKEIDKDSVLVEVPAVWFATFVRWLGSVPVVQVPAKYILAVHRVFGCFEESYEEVYGEQLPLFPDYKGDDNE